MSRTSEEKLLDPRPGSRIAAARDFGIDLTLLVAKLRKTPQERIDELQSAMEFQAELERAKRRGPLETSGNR